MTQPRVELEGRLHPLAVLVIARRFLGASILPVAVLLLSAGTKVLVPTLVVGLLVGVPLAILSWWRFRYRVDGRRLELQSGVLNRSVRTIPLDRVRGVIVTAPFLHRLLGLVRVEVEAAAGGGSQAELSLYAVSREEAQALRETLLGGARGEREEPASQQPLYRATPGLLALGGITDMRYLLAPAAVVGVVFNLADDLPGGIVERAADAAADRVPTDATGIALAAAAGIALVFAAAAAGSLLVDWAFTLRDEGERFAADRGLLTRRVVLIDGERIKGADVRDTPLRRPLRLASVSAVAAGLRRRTQGTVLAPVVRTEAVASLLEAVDPEAPDPHGRLVAHPPAARTRRLVRALALPCVLLVVSVLLGPAWAVAGAVTLVALALFLALDRYQQLGHAFNGRRLALREGSLRRRWSELDPDGVVAFALTSTPGQRRADICTLTLHLGQGAGSRRALDLGAGQATALLRTVWPQQFEQLLAPVESPAATEQPAR